MEDIQGSWIAVPIESSAIRNGGRVVGLRHRVGTELQMKALKNIVPIYWRIVIVVVSCYLNESYFLGIVVVEIVAFIVLRWREDLFLVRGGIHFKMVSIIAVQDVLVDVPIMVIVVLGNIEEAIVNLIVVIWEDVVRIRVLEVLS